MDMILIYLIEHIISIIPIFSYRQTGGYVIMKNLPSKKGAAVKQRPLCTLSVNYFVLLLAYHIMPAAAITTTAAMPIHNT